MARPSAVCVSLITLQLVTLIGGGVLRPAGAQETTFALADRAPHFVSEPVPGTLGRVDMSGLPLLRRRVSLTLADATLEDALREIARQAGLALSYSRDVAPLDRPVSMRAEDITVAAALTEVLLGTGVDVQLSPSGRAALVRRVGDVVPLLRQQAGTVVGRVTDATTGRPIAYATVMLDGLGHGVPTSDSGTYRIPNVTPGTYAARVRALGYVSARTPVTVVSDRVATADFALQRSASQLDQVVVTATGEQRRAEVGNVIAEVNVDSLIRNAPVNSFNDILTARVPGVEVLQANGYTGMAADIRIRGLSSLTVSNNPIIIMDGVRIDNKPGDLGLNGTQNEVGNFNSSWQSFGQISGSLVNINPDEIESLEVVKGPSATTLYGTDAANGVIVIKTKHGQVSKPRLTAYTEQGLVRSTGGIPDNYYAWGHALPSGAPTQCLLANEAAGLCKIDSVTVWNPLENPATSPMKTGNRQVYGGQISGGDATLRYFGSGEYEGERGYLQMPGSEQRRIASIEPGGIVPGYEINPNIMNKSTIRGNLVANLNPTSELSFSTGYLNNLTRVPPGFAVFYSGETGLGYRDPAFDGWDAFAGRPGDVFAIRGDQHSDRFTGSATHNWQSWSWLAGHETIGLDYTALYQDGLQRYGEGFAFFGAPTGSRWNSRSNTMLGSVDLGAKVTASPATDVRSTTSIGAQYNRTTLGQTTAAAKSLIPGSNVANGAADQFVGEVNQQNVVAGVYVQQDIGWRERLFATGALRADGSSAFGSNFRTALYPKVSLSWVVSQEPVLRGASAWLSSLRLRAAYGASGVQPNPTDKLATLVTTNALVDGTLQSGARPATIANTALKPERQAELETGLDAELWRGRLRVEGTYYDRESRDALIKLPLASSSGFLSEEFNIGAVRNRGVEGSITTQLLSWPAVSADVTVNGSLNHNTILRLAPGITTIIGDTPFFEQRVGYPLYGVFLQPILAYHANAQGIIGPNDITLGDSATYQGSEVPTRMLSVSGALSLLRGHVRLSSLFDYRGGYKFLDLGEGFFRCLIFSNCRAVNDPSTPAFQQAQAQEAILTGNQVIMNDGTYMRWRELALTLNPPEQWAWGLHGRSVSVTLSARNLALWTKVQGLQPERAYLDNAGFPDQRYAVPTAPLSRYWLVRLNMGL